MVVLPKNTDCPSHKSTNRTGDGGRARNNRDGPAPLRRFRGAVCLDFREACFVFGDAVDESDMPHYHVPDYGDFDSR